jgi:hypothetical protein
LLFACLTFVPACLAQVDTWEFLKTVQPGRNVRVKLKSNKALKGRMDAWRPEGMSLRQGGGKVVSLDKSEISEVALLIGKSRARRAAYAGLITAIGLGTLTGLAYSSADCCELAPAAVGAAFGAFGGMVAAGIAALFPQHHEVIYSARPAAP